MGTIVFLLAVAALMFFIFFKGSSSKSSQNVVRETRNKSVSKSKKERNSTQNISQDELLVFKQNKIPSEHYKPLKNVEDTSSFFYGKKVCISGTFDNFPIRPELSKHLWKIGADIDSGISKKLDILIIGDQPGPSKMSKAEDQGVYIMEEPELIEKLNGFKSKFL